MATNIPQAPETDAAAPVDTASAPAQPIENNEVPAATPAAAPTNFDEFLAANKADQTPTDFDGFLKANGAKHPPPQSGSIYDNWYENASSVAHVLSAFGQGAREGWGDSPNNQFGEETEKFLRKAGIFDDYAGGQKNLIKQFNEAMIRPAVTALTAPFRAMNAGFAGAQAGVQQVGVETGNEQLARDIAAMPEAFMGTPHPTGIPHLPAEIAQARSLGVIGESEAAFMGTAERKPLDPLFAEAENTRAAAEQAKAVPAEAAPPPKPDIHEVVRQQNPQLFNEYDDLSTRRDTFGRWMQELRDSQREEVSKPFQAEIDDLNGKMDDATPRLQKKYQARIDDLSEQMNSAVDEANKKPNPDIDRIRQAYQEADYRMRDLSPDVSKAYRDAQEQIGGEGVHPEAEVSPSLNEKPPEVSATEVPESKPATSDAGLSEEPDFNAHSDADLHALLAKAKNDLARMQDAKSGVNYDPASDPEKAAALDRNLTATEKAIPEYEAEIQRRTGLDRPNSVQTQTGAGPQYVAEISNDVSKKLVAAGRPQEEANAAGQIISSYYETRSARFDGKRGTAADLYNAEAPDIRVGNQTARQLELAQKDRRELSQGEIIRSFVEKRTKQISDEVEKIQSGIDAQTEKRLEQIADRLDQLDKHENIIQKQIPGLNNFAASWPWSRTTKRLKELEQSLRIIDRERAKLNLEALEHGLTRDELRPDYYQGKRGKITIIPNGRNIITLFKDADASTFIHETGHQFLEDILADAQHSEAPEALRNDAQTVRDWLGAKDGEAIKTRQHEKFARGFERYLMEGVAPSKELASVFAQFKGWLTKIYQSVKALKSPISDDIRHVFDRLLAEKPERTVIAPEREKPSFAEIHEADAENTAPEQAHPVAENIRSERDKIAAREVPEDNDARLEGIADQTGRREAGSPESNRDEPQAGTDSAEAGNAEAPGAIGEGGGEAEAARIGTRPEAPESPHERFGESDSVFVDKAGNIRLDNMNAPEDIKRSLREIAEKNDNFLSERGGVITDQQVLDMADASGLTHKEIQDFAKMMRLGPVVIKRAEKLFINASTEARTASKNFLESPSEANEMAAIKAVGRLEMIQGTFSSLTADPGRMLRALSKSPDWRKTGLNFGEEVTNASGRTPDQWRDLFQRTANLDTPQKVAKFVSDAKKPTFPDMSLEYWINALLSGPLTHIKNTLGNALVAANSIVETAVASGVGKILGSEDRVQLGEAKARWFGLTQGSVEGLQAAKNIMSGKEITGAHTVEVYKEAIPGIAGKIIRTPTRLLSAEDEVFKAIGYRQELNALAYRQAAKEGLDGTQFTSRVADMTQNPTPEMMTAAKKAAEYQTFTNSLGPTGRAIQNFANSHPLAKFVVPFIRTPTNILKYAAERTPFGLLFKDVRDNLTGKNGTIARDTQMARMAMGTSVVVGTVGLATQGIITGGGPSNPEQMDALRGTGWQPYSLKVGNMYYSYAWAEPFATILGTTADVVDIIKYGQQDQESVDKIAAAIVGGTAKNLLGKLSLRGVSDFIHAATDPERYGGGYVQSFLSSFIPGAVNQAEHVLDPTLREARTLIDAFKSRTPGLSETLYPRRDVWGEPITLQGAFGINGLSPIFQSRINNDPVKRALLDNGYYPSKLPRQIRNVELTAQQYDDYSNTAGKLAKTRLDAIVRNPGFASIPPVIKHDLIQKAITGAREQASMLMMMQYPSIMKTAVAAKIEPLKTGELRQRGTAQQVQ